MTWYITDGQRQHGPLEEAEVIQRISTRQISGGHIAWQGSDQWLPIESHPPFAQALQAAYYPADGLGSVASGAISAAPGGQVVPAARTRGKGKAWVFIAAGVALLTVVLGGGYGAVRMLSEGSDQVEAKLLEAELSKDDKTLTVSVELVSTGLIGPYVATEVNGRTVKLADGGLSSFGDERKLELKYDVSHLKPGEHEAIISVRAGKTRPADLHSNFTVKPRLRRFHLGLECEGSLKCEVKLENGNVMVSAPAGSTVTVAGSSSTADGNKRSIPLDLNASLASTPVASLFSDISIPVALKLKDGTELAGDLKVPGLEVKSMITTKLTAVKTGGVTFTGDDTAPSQPRALVLLKGRDKSEILGGGVGLNAIDLVAFRDSELRSGSCGSYTNSRTGTITTISKRMYDDKYTVYDRRTGKIISNRKLSAPAARCPSSMRASDSVVSFASESMGRAYLESLLGGESPSNTPAPVVPSTKKVGGGTGSNSGNSKSKSSSSGSQSKKKK